MRGALKILIVFSYMFTFTLAKNNLLFSKNYNMEKISESDQKQVHKVVSGESLSSIAGKYNVSMNDLLEWNHMGSHDKLYRGQKLIVRVENQRYGQVRRRQLFPGQSIRLYRPVNSWQILKGYISYGDGKNLGLLCKVGIKNDVRPANSGTIVKISYLRGYGKYILIDHGNGWHTLYSNIDEVKVKSGQYVNFSETIGNAKNNKLFFLLAYNGKPVNPTGYFTTAARD